MYGDEEEDKTIYSGWSPDAIPTKHIKDFIVRREIAEILFRAY